MSTDEQQQPAFQLTIDQIIDLFSITSEDEFLAELDTLNGRLGERYAFPDVDDTIRTKLASMIVTRLTSTDNCTINVKLIQLLRILCRDHHGIDQLMTDQLVDRMCTLAGLATHDCQVDVRVAIECGKCFSNALFHSASLRQRFVESNYLNALVSRIMLRDLTNADEHELELVKMSGHDGDAAGQLRLFDTRLCFIISAHLIDVQCQLRTTEFITVLTDWLEQHTTAGSTPLSTDLNENIALEILKLLFNIFCHQSDTNTVVDDKKQLQVERRLASVCGRLVRETIQNERWQIGQNAVNLLAAMPTVVAYLCPKIESDNPPQFDGFDMSFTDAILELFLKKMDTLEKSETELLNTYLTVMISLCRTLPEARRYVRLKIMPPLRVVDVQRRPEEGTELRNRLVRLMMSGSSARDLAAEFLFVLCKRSVSRLIKYSGFGNAAGLLANNGLLGRATAASTDTVDSEDSETEEYENVKDQVNPVSGFIEPPQPNPMENMSEEQKEYEAMKLVDSLNKLMNEGVIEPGTIGDDGRLRPVRHVLELQKAYEKGKGVDEDNDEDSD